METVTGRLLIVTIKEYYGRITIIPENTTAKLFADLLGQKTLTTENIRIIKDLGYEVQTRRVKL